LNPCRAGVDNCSRRGRGLDEQRQLGRELAEYRSDSARQDLYAMLSRHTAEETAPIERILNWQARTGGSAHNR
jgi:hypothetical protein